jgi:hypothetical protein
VRRGLSAYVHPLCWCMIISCTLDTVVPRSCCSSQWFSQRFSCVCAELIISADHLVYVGHSGAEILLSYSSSQWFSQRFSCGYAELKCAIARWTRWCRDPVVVVSGYAELKCAIARWTRWCRALTKPQDLRGEAQERERTSAYVSIRQHTSAYVSIRQHTSQDLRSEAQ